MKIKCPECSTSYDIKPEALGSEGRSVKCARCGNRWFVRPKGDAADAEPADADQNDAPKTNAGADEADWVEDEAREEKAAGALNTEKSAKDDEAAKSPGSSAEPAAEAAMASASEMLPDTPSDDDDDLEDQPVDIESSAKRPKIKVNPNKFKRNHLGAVLNWLARRNYRRIGGIVLFTGAIAACLFLVLIRDEVVKQAPDLASLFEAIGLEVNLRGLEFRDLRTFTEVEGGKQVLVVEGSIRNIGEENTPVPAVRLSIRGTDLQEIYAWTVEPRTTTLNGLDETRFRTILSDPPPGASDIHVRFINRGQRQVVLE
jgi:predicted Zn finger-like uncharacterized protein